MPTPGDVNKHNADVAQKLASQDIMGIGTHVPDNLEVGAGLDKLMQEAEKASTEPKPEDKVEPKPEPKAGDTPPAKADDKPPGDTPPTKTAEELAREEASKRAEDLFKDAPQLPPNASPKSSEAFSAIKIKAAQEISAREQELEKLRKENADMVEKLKNPVPDNVAKELEDHRQWRARLDVEADPKFKEFDKTIEATRDFIYEQLKKSPAISDAVIEEIKKHGGPEMIKLEKIFAAIKDPTLQTLVEQSVKDIEKAKWSKQQAIASTKKNITEYLAEREKTLTAETTGRAEAVDRELKVITSKIPWFKELPVDPKADEKTRKGAEAHNEFLKTLNKQLEDVKNDNSPEMKAIQLAGMAQLFYLQGVHASVKAELEAVKKANAELTEKLDKFKKGSLSHIRESGAPAGNTKVKPTEKDIFSTPATSALDSLRDQVVLERERALGTK